MKSEKSLEEVRRWKEEINSGYAGLNKSEIMKKMQEESAAIKRERKLKLRTLSLASKP